MDVTTVALKLHVAHDLLDVNKSRLCFELQLGFFGNGKLQVSLKFESICRRVQNARRNVDAIAHLLDFKANLVGGLRTDHIYFRVLPGLNLDAPIGHVVNYNDGPSRDAELFFNTLPDASGAGGRGAPEKKSGA